MKKRTSTVLIIISLLFSSCGFFKKNPDIENKKADFKITAVNLISESEKMDTAINRKYNDKVLEISGKVSKTLPGDSVTSVIIGQSSTDISIEMYARHNELAKNLKIGEEVVIKALYIAYLPADPILISMGDSTARGTITLKKGSFVK